MTDVLLTHSYHLPYDRKQVRKMQPYLPLGTLYAASVLRAQKIPVPGAVRCRRGVGHYLRNNRSIGPIGRRDLRKRVIQP